MSLLEESEQSTGTPPLRPRENGGLPKRGAVKKGKLTPKRIIALLIVVCLLAGGGIAAYQWWLVARLVESTDDAFIDGRIIPISPQVAARVLAVHVNDNDFVKKGEALVDLDPTDYQVVLDQDQATEAAARGRLEEARTQVAVTQANVGQAKAELDAALTNAQNMQEDYQRFTRLDPRARSQQQMDNSAAAQRSTAATVEQARAKVDAAQAQVVDAQASIVTAQANLAKAEADTLQAQIQLSYCKIVAPEDGTVTHKSVEPGQYLEIGQPLFSIVPTDVWVTANYKETQLDLMHPGEPVTISVDAYPEHEFRGHVQSIQNGTGSKFTLLPPENATGNFVKVVQRVPVKIVFEPDQTNDPDHPLGLGMSVIAKVKVRS